MASMSIAPPGFLPVLLGHGSFLRDGDGNVKLDSDGQPLYLIPPSDVFLDMKPSKESQQFWPVKDVPGNMSIVLLGITVNTDCQTEDVITEVGYTIFDTGAIYTGAKGSRKRRVMGCMAPGARGENITKLALSQHFIVRDTAKHHPGTCNLPAHKAQPYHFSFRKSKFIDRVQIDQTIEEAFYRASCQGLAPENIKEGVRRTVVLLGWGEKSHHPQVKAASWYKENQIFQQWDIRKHPLVLGGVPHGSYLDCLDVFGIQHRAHGKEIAHNAGNRTAFTMQLLINLCFLTEKQQAEIKSGLRLTHSPKFPGVESVLARDNRPPGSAPLPIGRVPILH